MPTLSDTQIRLAIYALCFRYYQNGGSGDVALLDTASSLAYTTLLNAYFEGILASYNIVYHIPETP